MTSDSSTERPSTTTALSVCDSGARTGDSLRRTPISETEAGTSTEFSVLTLAQSSIPGGGVTSRFVDETVPSFE